MPSYALLRLSALAALGLALSACSTTSGGLDDLFGSVAPTTAAPRATNTLPRPPGLPADPAAAPLTPGRIGAPPAAPSGVSSGAPPVAQVNDELDNHLPAAPPMRVEALGDLPRRADGVMILPPGPKLDVIDIGAVRDGLSQTQPRTSTPMGAPVEPSVAPVGRAPGAPAPAPLAPPSAAPLPGAPPTAAPPSSSNTGPAAQSGFL